MAKSWMIVPTRIAGLLLLLVSNLPVTTAPDEANSADRRDPTVGAAGQILQIILPGTELQGVPIDPDSPMIVRVRKSFPHGDRFRYDIEFHGLEPGQYDLAKWLQRKDGSNTDDLPEIPVEIRSLLPPGQIEPNPLQRGVLPRLGEYRTAAIAVALLWFAVLMFLIFGNRKQPVELVELEQPKTLAQLLRPRLAAAARNEIEPAQYAELERMLFAFWRHRLELEDESAEDALAKIKRHDTAGPLMRQLEHWMHDPATNRDVDLPRLLKPYENIPVEEAGAAP